MEAFILSRNRAMQLDGLLQSLYKNTTDLVRIVDILYASSNDEFERAYQTLADHWLKNGKFVVRWFKESSFRKDFLKLLEEIMMFDDYVLGLTDDTFLYRKFNATQDELESLFDKKTICCSLRLGKNTRIQNCANGMEMPEIPTLHERATFAGEKFLFWDYKKCSMDYNIGYPVSIDGHIYKSLDLYTFSEALPWETLRNWEGTLVEWVKNNAEPNLMFAPQESCCVNIPFNFTQPPFLHHSQVSPHGQSLQELNDRYLGGERIDIDEMFKLTKIIGSHQLLPLKFRKDQP